MRATFWFSIVFGLLPLCGWALNPLAVAAKPSAVDGDRPSEAKLAFAEPRMEWEGESGPLRVYISVQNRTDVPFLLNHVQFPYLNSPAVSVKFDDQKPSTSLPVRIEPSHQVTVVLVLPEDVLHRTRGARVLTPLFLGYFLKEENNTFMAYAVSSKPLLVTDHQKMHFVCYWTSQQTWYELDPGVEVDMGGTESEFLTEQPMYCENQTAFPARVSVDVVSSAEKNYFQLVPNDSNSLSDALLQPGEHISFSIRYNAPKSTSVVGGDPVKYQASLRVKAWGENKQDWRGETIEHPLKGLLYSTATENIKPDFRVQAKWGTIGAHGVAPCPLHLLGASNGSQQFDFGTYWKGEKFLSNDCRMVIQMIPPSPDEVYAFDIRYNISGDKEYFVVGEEKLKNDPSQKRIYAFLSNDIRFADKPFPMDGKRQITVHVTLKYKPTMGSDEQIKEYDYTFGVTFKTPVRHDKVVLGSVRVGTRYYLPGNFKSRLSSGNTFHWKPFVENAPVHIFPKNDKEIPQDWDGRVGVELLPETMRSGTAWAQMSAMPLALVLGPIDSPDAIEFFPLELKVNSVLSQPQQVLDGVDTMRDVSFVLPWENSLRIAEVVRATIRPVQDNKHVVWQIDGLPGISAINGALPPLYASVRFDNTASAKQWHEAVAEVTVNTTDGQRWVLQTPIKARPHTRSNVVLDAAMLVGGVREGGDVASFHWASRVGLLYHLRGERFGWSGTHESFPVGLSLEGGYLSASQTPFVGLVARFGVMVFPGEQRFWQVGAMGYFGFRYGSIGRDRLLPEDTAARYTDSAGLSVGLEPTLQLYLGDKAPKAAGWILQAGVRVGGLLGAGTVGFSPDLGAVVGVGYRFGSR